MKTTEQHSNVVVRYIFLTVGAISFVLGTAGIVIPLLPTVPFYMLTLFCLARGSERFHNMFLESSLYQKTVGAYERDKALTLRTKLSILLSVSTIMAIGAYFSQDMPIALIVMAFVWISHVIALVFIVKTKKIKNYL
ncbi:MAG: YbaN family protein [Veillonella dispar]|nr:YbaN family protein [Veillonella dispar]MBS6383153.1 YbaN family protein [Veillonella dispar]MDU6959375.1 YbaN family protein [Veillonella dispar]